MRIRFVYSLGKKWGNENGQSTISFFFLFLTLGVISGFLINTGPFVQKIFGHDDFIYLDGAWKVINGLKPNIDFNSQISPMIYFLTAAGMKLGGYNANSIVIGNILLCLTVIGISWNSISSRYSPLISYWFMLFTALLMFRANLLRFPYDYSSYAGLYNLQSYSILILILPLLFIPRQIQQSKYALFDSVIIGILFGILLLIKYSYFFIGLFILITYLFICGFENRISLKPSGWALGLIVAILPYLFYIDFDIRNLVNDISITVYARSQTIDINYFRSVSTELIINILPVMLMGFTCLGLKISNSRELLNRDQFRLILILFIVLNGNILILLTNARDGDINELPLYISTTFIFLEYCRREYKNSKKHLGQKIIFMNGIVLSICILSIPILNNYFGIKSAVTSKTISSKTITPSEIFQEPTISSFILLDSGGDAPFPSTYVEKINDGFDLLRKKTASTSRIASFDFSNPFPFSMQRPPSSSPTVWFIGNTFDKTHFPDEEKVFQMVDAIIIPKYSGDPATTQALLEIYDKYLTANFIIIGESTNWKLMGRIK